MKTTSGYVNHDANLECTVLYENESGSTYIQHNGMIYRVAYNEELDVWDPVELVTDQVSIN